MSDLNLSTATDIQETCQRIQSTANRLCYRLINDNMLAAQVLYEACARAAVADAMRRLHAAIRLADNCMPRIARLVLPAQTGREREIAF